MFFRITAIKNNYPVIPEASSLAFKLAVHANGFCDINRTLVFKAQSTGK